MSVTSRKLDVDSPEAVASRMRVNAINVIQKIVELPETTWKFDGKIKSGFLAPPKVSNFKNMDADLLLKRHDDDWWLFHPDDCTPQVVWPLDCGVIVDHEPGSESSLTLIRAHTIAPREARGLVDRFGPYMLRILIGEVFDGQLVTAANIMVYLNGKWVEARSKQYDGRDFQFQNKGDERAAIQPGLLIGHALRHRYEWAVSIGFENTPTIRFATDPTGIKEVFKLRELPAGRDRRAALMSWVSDHWRQDRNDGDIELYVRKHLRGTTNFRWRDMVGQILPSQFDLEQREKFLSERQAMKIAGTDVRLKDKVA